MTTLREAAQKALEALDYCIEHSAEIVAERAKDRGQGSDDLQMMMVEYLEKHRCVITTLRAALAEQDDDLTAAWMAGAAEGRKRAEQPQPLTDKEILSAVGWERAEMYMQLLPNFPANEAKQETLKNARAVEAEVIRRMGVQR